MGGGGGLVWRDGEQSLDAWIEWVRRCLVGDGGFRVIGDVQWPDQPYGRELHSGLDAAGLADVFRGAGVTALYVSTTHGLELSSPGVEIMPVPVGPPGPPLLRAQAEPGGSVRLAAPVRNFAELDAWLTQLSPLLPRPVPARGGSEAPFARPLAGGLLGRPDGIRLCLDTLESRLRRFGNPTSVVSLISSAERLADDTVLLRDPRVVEESTVGTVHELAEALAALERVWSPGGVPDGSPFTGLGIWAGSGVVGSGSRIRVVRIEHGSAQLSITRRRTPELRAEGAATELAIWARPLLDPAVHATAYAGRRRALVTWLERLERAVFGTPARWSVSGGRNEEVPAGPLDASGLGQWLHSRFPQQRVSAGLVTADSLQLDDLLTGTGRLTVTAHRG
ncbi:hypothetical protein LRD69_29035 [Streptomyces sp. JH14]|uniref:hypothetical protein n=1 Tax=Streptomyces sp. JH14 TaxID=2793630 RepID=UPI0023F73F9B|nr:hypothetical protein [Streptomyces sp. JH14]MDF6046098.1 hypothetical protein [Streptomyces sp. JH14]